MKQERILIIRPDRLGDVVVTTPLIREVKKKFPNSFLAVMVHPASGLILHNSPHIDLIITDDPEGNDSGKKGFWKKVREVSKLKFTIGLMPLPRERHAWMMFFAGIKKRIGVGTKLYQILTGMSSVSRNKYIPLRHEADYVMDLGRKIGIVTDDLTTEIFVTNEEEEYAKQFLLSHHFDLTKPIIGINPSSNRSAPNWRPEMYAQLCERLSATHQLFINIGMPNPELESHFEQFKEKHIVYSGTNLRNLIALSKFFTVLISSSTGTMHIAAALKIPTVTMFCPLTACSPKLWGPLGNRSEVILPEDGFCQGRCAKDPKICTFDELSVEQVISRLKIFINL